MGNKKISVIVPIYDVENFLSQCVDSILCQTYSNLEIILVDDASPDNCPKICDDYAKKDKRIKVVHQKNGGLSDARNTGLCVATGELIGFVDSDDWIDPNMYKELTTLMNETSADIAICAPILYADGELKYTSTSGNKTLLNKEEALDQLFLDDRIKSHVWDKLYRKEVFEGILFPKGKCFEDIYIMHEVFAKANSVALIEKSLYYYRARKASITHSVNINKVMDRLYGLECRFNSNVAKGREKYAPQHFFYAANLSKQAVFLSNFDLYKRHKYNKKINFYLLKYCKGSSLSLKDRFIKWILILAPNLFYNIILKTKKG
ncbi:MAG: glycosyltransferase, partial [Firmicutes bacterium]|nr:glycosyltransferase [Bacillota bacterium]